MVKVMSLVNCDTLDVMSKLQKWKWPFKYHKFLAKKQQQKKTPENIILIKEAHAREINDKGTEFSYLKTIKRGWWWGSKLCRSSVDALLVVWRNRCDANLLHYCDNSCIKCSLGGAGRHLGWVLRSRSMHYLSLEVL